MREAVLRLRYRYWPDHLLGEILSKRWTETAIPVIVLLIVAVLFTRAIPGFLSPASLADTARQAGEIGFVVLGMALVIVVGGIDLSVGSMFALSDFCALFCLNVLGLAGAGGRRRRPIAFGALLGAVNGLLIGYLRLRAFITTLITLIIYRSAYDLLLFDYSNTIAAAFPDIAAPGTSSAAATSLGVPSVALLYVVVAIFGHVFLTRLRPGWHITAIGGSRRSAYNSGIPVRAHDRPVLRRQRRADRDRRAVLRRPPRHGRRRRRRRPRGHRADGGRARRHQPGRRPGLGRQGAGRHADRAVLITNGLTTLSVRGGVNRMVLAGSPAGRRHDRHPLAEEPQPHHQPRSMSARPFMSCRRCIDSRAGSGAPFAQNDKLRDVTLIGLGRIEAPEDVILDRNDNLYAGSRHGDIIRFFAPDYERDGGLRPYRRPAARHGVRPQRQPLCLHRRHGALPHHARPQGREGDRRDQPQPATRSTTTAACGWPTISTSPTTAASSSPRPRSATRCTNGRSTAWRRAATAASSATTRTPAPRARCCAA